MSNANRVYNSPKYDSISVGYPYRGNFPLVGHNEEYCGHWKCSQCSRKMRKPITGNKLCPLCILQRKKTNV